MGNIPNDNRMGWIRNAERLSSAPSAPSYYFEYELGSECRISGLLDYCNEGILLGGSSIERDRRGLNHYLLKIKFPRMEDGNDSYKNASRKGYFFRDGVAGEIISLLSIYYRCRFYLLSTSFGDLTGSSLKIKDEHEFTYLPCNHQIHPQIFSDDHGNFAKGFADFLDSIKSLDQKYHQQFILACHHYQRALKEVGVDAEMVFIRLVSSIETLLQFFKLSAKEDVLRGKDFDQVINSIKDLSEKEKGELAKIFEVRKTRARFVEFVYQYSTSYFRGGNYKARHTKVKKMDLRKTLRSIYDARSGYLHNGEPMYLSFPMRGATKWDTDPSLGMTIDNRKMAASQKMPYPYFFEGLVRHCLLNFLRSSVSRS